MGNFTKVVTEKPPRASLSVVSTASSDDWPGIDLTTLL